MVYALLIAAAVALLATLHVLMSRRGEKTGRLLGLAGGADPWARFLVATALGATLFALGVIAVPALLGDDESTVSGTTSEPTTTMPTTTIPPTTASSTTAPEPTTSASTTAATTTAPTTPTNTTAPTTTVQTTTLPPPEGKVVLAQATVDGPSGQIVGSVSRLGASPTVRRIADGIFRIVVPGLSEGARERTTVRIRAGSDTQATVRRPAGTETLIVLTTNADTGSPVSRDFTIVLWGARSDIPKLPKTS